jgi:branched-chain amino acid transport system substrate-binding protein
MRPAGWFGGLATGLAAALALVACGAVGTGGSSGGQASQGGTVDVGVIMPLTGGNAQFGLNSLHGVQLEAQEINRAGGIKSMGGAKINVLSADATSDPTQAAAVTQNFISSHHVLALIGMYASALTITSAQVSDRAGIPLLSTGFSDTLTSSGYHDFFRVGPKASAVGTIQLTAALALAKQTGHGIKSIAIVFENDAFGTGTATGLKAAAQAAGLKVAVYEPYSKDITDATPVARAVLAAHPDAIFPTSYLTDGTLLMRALHAEGNAAPIFAGVGGFVEPDFHQALGDVVNGIFVADTASPDQYGKIADTYQKQYGAFITQEAHDNATALSIIAQALEAHPTRDPATLADTLHRTNFCQGLAATMAGGCVKFDDAGNDVDEHPVMCQWQNGQLVGVWPEQYVSHKPTWPTA